MEYYLPLHSHRIVAMALDRRYQDVSEAVDQLTDESQEHLSCLLGSLVAKGFTQWTSILVSKGADPSFRDKMGSTPLTDVIVSNLPSSQAFAVVEQLLQLGADPNGIGVGACPPLVLAIDAKNPEMVELLIDFGADVELRSIDQDGGTSAAELAREKGNDWVRSAMERAHIKRKS